MRIGEAAAARIRHRMVLAQDEYRENPESRGLHDRADAETWLVGAITHSVATVS